MRSGITCTASTPPIRTHVLILASAGGSRHCSRTAAAKSSCSTRCFFPCPARRSFIMEMRSAWVTTFISAIATVAAHRCNGVPTAMPDFQEPIRSSFICRLRSIRNITTKRSTSRISRKIFPRCSLEFLHPDNAKVLAFLRRYEKETIVVVVNLSRFAQSVELDLSHFAGCVPMEVFSRNLFRPIKKSPYVITLGPHAYYWFALQPQTNGRRVSKKHVVPTINAPAELHTLLDDGRRAQLEQVILPNYIQTCRWFGSKARTLRDLKVVEQPAVSSETDAARFWFVVVSYVDGPTETYALPVKIASGNAARVVSRSAPHAIIARLAGPQETILYDAVWDEKFRSQLFEAIAQRQIMKGHVGDLVGIAGKALAADSSVTLDKSQVFSGEQSNSSMLFDNKFFLKLYRKLEDGVNPDVAITRFLTERANFSNVPAFAGALEYRRPKTEPTVVCLLQRAAANEGDAWTLTLDAVGRYYERVLGRKADLQNQTAPPGSLLDELIGGVYPEKAMLLGQRTGELHL